MPSSRQQQKAELAPPFSMTAQIAKLEITVNSRTAARHGDAGIAALCQAASYHEMLAILSLFDTFQKKSPCSYENVILIISG